MYLGYLDDSRNRDWQVVSAVLVPADSFMLLEMMAATTVEGVMPEDRLEKFEEFHASELYNGEKPFDGIDQRTRFAAITALLANLQQYGFRVAYGALNLRQHEQSVYGGAIPQDVAFRRCVSGAGDWIGQKAIEELGNGGNAEHYSALFIMDEAAQGDKDTQRTIQRSFRSLRTRFRFSNPQGNRLPFVHDDIYFGDSKFSVGIQMADLCSYFIGRHLREDKETEHFYKMIEPQIVSAVTQ